MKRKAIPAGKKNPSEKKYVDPTDVKDDQDIESGQHRRSAKTGGRGPGRTWGQKKTYGEGGGRLVKRCRKAIRKSKEIGPETLAKERERKKKNNGERKENKPC